MIWDDSTDSSGFYKGWNVVFGAQRDATKLTVELLDWLQTQMSVDTVTLLLPTPEGNLAVKATSGLEEEITQQIRIPIGQGIAGRIAARGEPMIVDDLSAVEVFSPILRDKGVKSLVGIPILLTPTMIGVLHVGTLAPRQFNQRDVQQLQLVAQQLQSILLGRRPSNATSEYRWLQSSLLRGWASCIRCEWA
jgi:L-methionine (R)-S-oxide reductase